MKISKTGYKKNSKDKNEPALVIPSNKITMKDVDFPVYGTDDTGYSQMMYPGLDYTFPGSYVYELPMNNGSWLNKYQQGGDTQNGPTGPSKVIGGKLEISYDKNDNVYLRALNTKNWTKVEGDKAKEFTTKFAEYLPGYFDPAGSVKKIAKKAATEVPTPKPAAQQKPKNQGVSLMLDEPTAQPKVFDRFFSNLTDPKKIEQNEQEKLSSKYQTSQEYRWSPYNSLDYANKEYEKTPDYSLRYKNINDYTTQDISKVQSYLDSKGYYSSNKPLINTGDYKTPDEIRELQKYLVQEGLAETLGLNNKNSSLSGKFDKNTLAAIEKFNKSNAKFSSGVLDSTTKDAIRNFRNETDAQSKLNIPVTDPFALYDSKTGKPLVDKTYEAMADFENELMKKGFFRGNVNYDFSSKATDNPLIGYNFKLNKSDDTQWDGCAQYLNNTVCNDIVGEDIREELGFKGDAWSISENLRAKGGKLIFAGLPERSEVALRPGDNINSYLKTTLNSPDIKGSLQTMSNNGEIKPGDVVNIFYEGSPSDTKAFNQSKEVNGRFFTTHVGVIKADDNGKLYVEHNIHKKIHKDPLQDFIDGKVAGNGKNKVSLISGITRPNYYQGVDNNGAIKPEGISYYQTEYGKFNPKGALANKDDSAGQMVSGKNVYDYLSVIEHNKDAILKDIPITDNEFGKLMRVARIIPVKETSASADPLKLNMRAIDDEGYFKVNTSVLKPLENLGLRDEVSMGFTRLKDESNLNPKLRSALYNDDDTQLDNPVKAGIPTFYVLSKNYLYLKEVMNQYGVKMTSDQLAKLAGLGYNQSIGKIASQVVEQGGYDNYINFRRNNAGKDDRSFQYSEAVDLYDKQTMKLGGITAPGRFKNPEGNWVSKYANGGPGDSKRVTINANQQTSNDRNVFQESSVIQNPNNIEDTIKMYTRSVNVPGKEEKFMEYFQTPDSSSFKYNHPFFGQHEIVTRNPLLKKLGDKYFSSKFDMGGDISIPDLSKSSWLTKYQKGSEVKNQNGLIYESPTEPGLYESKYSLNPVNVTPNWTEAELERNRLRDEYIEKDKKIWAHWHDKLGYDRRNVDKRAKQYAYNTLAKQYLKGEKENLTPEQRKFIERSEYANRLQPSVASRFVEGITNPGFNLETLSNLAAPLEYPTNLVRGAVVGEFADALMGETPSPYFVSSDRPGSSPTEAAIMSGLMDFGVDAGLGAIGEVVPLSKGINAAGKYLNNKYVNIAEGANPFDYAWRSPAVGLSQSASDDMFRSLANSGKLAPEERALVLEYQHGSRNFTGRGLHKVDQEKRQALNNIINKYKAEIGDDVVLTRMFSDRPDALGATLENGKLNFGDRPTSFTAGVQPPGYGKSVNRVVVPKRYSKQMGDKFLVNQYDKPSEDVLKYLDEDAKDWASWLGTNANVEQERELIGTGLEFKQIGKVKNDIGGYDYIVKPINTKSSKTLPGSPNVSSVDDVGRGLTNPPQQWQLEELPGLHLKSTMEGEAISKIVEPKTGLINTEQALAIIGKESGGADKVALIRKGLGDKIPKKMDFNEFRKITQEQLIPLKRKIVDYRSEYGLNRLGYANLEDIVRDAQGNAVRKKYSIGEKPLENQTLLLSNKGKFGRGSGAHGNPEETLGHIHFLRDAETPDVLTVTQIQSDAFQGTHRIMPKDSKNLTALEKQQKSLARMEELQQRNRSVLNKMKTEGVDEAGVPVQDYQIKQFEDLVEAQEKSNLFKKTEIENFSQKSLLDKNHQERYLQELVGYAAERGDVNKLRLPTKETAAKVQGYSPVSELNKSEEFINLRKNIVEALETYGNNSQQYKKATEVYENAVKNSKKVYSSEHQTILKKYAEQPKTIKKLFGVEPKVVTDSKGNSWYEFDIPENFKKGKGEIKAYRYGGWLDKYQNGGSRDMPLGLPLREQNPYLVPEYNQPMANGYILPDPNRPQLMNTGATEYKYSYGVDDRDVQVPSVVAGQYIGDNAFDRYMISGEEFKPMADPGSYSKFYDMIEKLGLMKQKKGGVKSQGEGYYDYINGYSGIFANGGTKSKENSWLNKYK
jgi:hypothetical protein